MNNKSRSNFLIYVNTWGTIYIQSEYFSRQVYPQISRINVYGDQAICVIDKLPDLRKYCLCKHKRDEG